MPIPGFTSVPDVTVKTTAKVNQYNGLNANVEALHDALALITDGVGNITGTSPQTRAWGKVTNNGVAATLVDGYNVTSVTRDSQGVVSIVFTANVGADYTVEGSIIDPGAYGYRAHFGHKSPLTGSVKIVTYNDAAPDVVDANFTFEVVN